MTTLKMMVTTIWEIGLKVLPKIMENKIEHLKMVQNTISRMSANSFNLKGWSITLITGLVALHKNSLAIISPLLFLLPLLVFWGLDAYYLYQERLFRRLYDKVRRDEISNFEMNPSCDNTTGKNSMDSMSIVTYRVCVLLFSYFNFMHYILFMIIPSCL